MREFFELTACFHFHAIEIFICFVFQKMALIQAIKQGSIRGIQLVIGKYDAENGSCQKEAGTTPLIEACKFGDKRIGLKMAKLLLKSNAEISDTDYLGRNAMHWACSKGQKDIVDLFMKSVEPVDLNYKDLDGNSVLYHAVSSGDCDFIKYVCRMYDKNGGGVETTNKQGISAVDLALQLGHKSCAALVNKVTGLNHFLSTAGKNELNRCLTNRIKKNNLEEPPGVNYRTRSFDETRETDPLHRNPRYDHHRRKYQEKQLARSHEEFRVEDSMKLPKLEVGNLSIVGMYNRQRSQTVPQFKDETREERLLRRRHIFKTEVRPEMSFSQDSNFPNTYKDILVDFNTICSVEKSPSYRKGAEKPKEKDKAKVVTFSESVDEDKRKSEDTKHEEKVVKNKARKISRVSEAKMAFAGAGKKERRKSRKSRDET